MKKRLDKRVWVVKYGGVKCRLSDCTVGLKRRIGISLRFTLVKMFSLRTVKNNCNDYYSGYSELSVGGVKKGMVWRMVQEWTSVETND